MVAFARTKRSKFDSTRTLSEADFWSMDWERTSSPLISDCVSAVACICDKNSAGEKVVDERRNRLPIESSVSIAPAGPSQSSSIRPRLTKPQVILERDS